MFLLYWVSGIFVLLSLFHGMMAWMGVSQNEAVIVIWGPYNVGKATLHAWLTNRYLNRKDPSIGKIDFKVLESAGVLICPTTWRLVYEPFEIDAVVYLMDADGGGGREIARYRNELHRLLENDILRNVPFLIFGQSSSRYFDLQSVCNMVEHYLGLITTGKGKVYLAAGVRPIEIHTYSYHNRFGGEFWKGFNWLCQYIN